MPIQAQLEVLKSCYLERLRQQAAARRGQANLDYRPLLSVLMPTYNTPPIYLEATVRSVMEQAYPNWELRIVDDGSSNSETLKALERIASLDDRIFVVRNAQNRGISAATNEALWEARGDYVAMLDHDDELTVDALYEIVRALNAERTTDVMYTDQDYISAEGKPVGQLLKPDWSPALFRGVMYVGHLLTVRRTLALDVGGFDSTFDFVQDYEFMLRVSERTQRIRHVPKVLYHWRRIPESVAGGGKANQNIEKRQADAVQAHLQRQSLVGRARSDPRQPLRVVIEVDDQQQRNTAFDLMVHGPGIPETHAAALKSALARTGCQAERVVIPAKSSGVQMEDSAELAADGADRDFSDADRLSRFLMESSAEFVVAISANVTIETDAWMEKLLIAAQESDVCAVCPAILSSDRLIAHAGLVVDGDGKCCPAMQGFRPDGDGYAGSLSCVREISAAWADLVLLRRSALTDFLPQNSVFVTADFLIAHLILRATRSGLRALCVPHVQAAAQRPGSPMVTTGSTHCSIRISGPARLPAILFTTRTSLMAAQITPDALPFHLSAGNNVPSRLNQ